MPFFAQTAAKTPYSLGEVVSGGILMENFKISSEKFLSTVIDAGAAFKKPIEEVVRSMGYIKTGRYGEGVESLAQIGITRDDLKELGIKFEKSGGVAQESQAKIFDAVIGVMKSRFGGTSERISKTYEGSISNLGDSVFQAFSNAFSKLLPYATASITYISDAVTKIGESFGKINWREMGEALVNSVSKAADWFSSVDWTGWGQTVVDTAAQVANAFGKLFSGEGRDELVKGISGAWNVIKGGIPSIMTGVVVDLRNAGKWMGDYIEISIGRALDFSMGGFTIGNLIAMAIENALTVQINTLRTILVYSLGILGNLCTWLVQGIAKTINYVWKLPENSFMGKLAAKPIGDPSLNAIDQWDNLIPKPPKSSVDTVTDAWSTDFATRRKRMLLESKQPFKSATWEAVSGITPDLWKNLQGIGATQSGPGSQVTSDKDLSDENAMVERANKEYDKAREAEAKELKKIQEAQLAIEQEKLKVALMTNNYMRKFLEISQSSLVESLK